MESKDNKNPGKRGKNFSTDLDRNWHTRETLPVEQDAFMQEPPIVIEMPKPSAIFTEIENLPTVAKKLEAYQKLYTTIWIKLNAILEKERAKL
jgi:hypothetical protein